MNELVEQLERVVSEITAAQESGKENRRRAKVMTDAADVLAEIEPELAEPIRVLADELAAKSGGKGEATDKLRNRVRGLVEAEILDDDDQARALSILDDYKNLSGGDRVRVNSGVTTPDFPFAIKALYNGVQVAYEGQRSGHAYWNSVRHACRKYETKVLGSPELSGNGEWQAAKAAFMAGETVVKAGLFDLMRV